MTTQDLTPEQRFYAASSEITKAVEEAIQAICGEKPRFMLCVTFERPSAGLVVGNITPESMKAIAKNLIQGMTETVPPELRGGMQ